MKKIKRRQTTHLRHQHGVTLVELLVAMTLSLVVVAATVAALGMARQGFSTIDAASQLRDNTRFSAELIQRIVQQAGYRDVLYAGATRSNAFKYAGMPSNTEPANVQGFNNALVTSADDPIDTAANNSRTAAAGGCATATDTACVNGSDILIIRFQPAAQVVGGGVSDEAVINCAGTSGSQSATNRTDRLVSIFYVALSNGEPSLMCKSARGTGPWQDAQPLVQGVESFQVLYGVDDVAPGAVAGAQPDSVPDRYLRADQMTVAGNAAATRANWLRVRSVRIGLVVRAAERSAAEKVEKDFYPLGSNTFSASDAGSKFVAPADGRIRQAFTFTVYLPNPQEI
ncbi:PilW family protein [uncultured Xylophilus sp.]|uniref:PilW family protein n=1 Tax=uncultured Xylophilus sp. TaxID=296832 RepID=UPI0025F311CE|nr:PilW family protein [uncultured Xylophilus sp.]